MEIGERISELRKNLNLNQEDFGKKINVTRSAVSNYEKGLRNVMDRVITDICREYSVNEEWLRNGTGEMFIEKDSTIVAELASEYNLDSKGIKFIEAFLNLTSEQQSVLQDLALNFAKAIAKDDEVTATKEVDDDPIVKYEMNAYRAELVAEQKGEIYSASENSEENSENQNLA